MGRIGPDAPFDRPLRVMNALAASAAMAADCVECGESMGVETSMRNGRPCHVRCPRDYHGPVGDAQHRHRRATALRSLLKTATSQGYHFGDAESARAEYEALVADRDDARLRARAAVRVLLKHGLAGEYFAVYEKLKENGDD